MSKWKCSLRMEEKSSRRCVGPFQESFEDWKDRGRTRDGQIHTKHGVVFGGKESSNIEKKKT